MRILVLTDTQHRHLQMVLADADARFQQNPCFDDEELDAAFPDLIQVVAQADCVDDLRAHVFLQRLQLVVEEEAEILANNGEL